MKKYFIISLTILLLSSLSIISCVKEVPKEKQILEETYKYLITEAKNSSANSAMLSIDWKFHSALIEENRKAILSGDNLGKEVELDFLAPLESISDDVSLTVYISALKNIVKNKENGFWSIAINEWIFQYNEDEVVVTALNQEAANLIDSIKLETYYNIKNGYYIDYPAGWTVDDTNSDAVVIKGEFYQDAMMIAVDNLGFVELDQYIEGRVLWFVIGSWEIDIIQKVDFYYENYPARKVDFSYFIVEDDDEYRARTYFIVKNGKVYQLFVSASQPDFLYDPIASFHFHLTPT